MTTDAEKIFGSWYLASWRAELPTGQVFYPIGGDAMGYISYNADQAMSVMMMRRDRPHYGEGNPGAGTDGEIRAAFNGFVAYAGRYFVDEENKRISHQVDLCWYPNWVGTELTRSYEVDGDSLILRAIADPGSSSDLAAALQVLEWRRTQPVHS